MSMDTEGADADRSPAGGASGSPLSDLEIIVDQQREACESALDDLNAAGQTAAEIADRARTLDETSVGAVEQAETGRERAEELIRGIEEVAEYRDEVEGYVEELVTGMEEIRDVAAVIEDVADRTNILAMNAAIEAARAQQGGEGFGVVADEVKELAEKTNERVDQIDETIDRMGDASGGSVVALEELDERLEANAVAAQDAVSSIDDVASEARRTAEEAGDIASMAGQQADAADRAVERVDATSPDPGRLSELLGELEASGTARTAADGGRDDAAGDTAGDRAPDEEVGGGEVASTGDRA